MDRNGATPRAEEQETLLNKAPDPPSAPVRSQGSLRPSEPLPPVPEDEPPAAVLVLPPDGGYGWVIVAASFLANMMVDGIAYAYGILLVELVAYFEESKAKVSLVGSLLCGVYLCTGPIAAALVQLYGCRTITIVGSVISCVGLALSTQAPNVEVLIFTYGVMGGFGFGLVYLPSTIVVNLYFEKRRSLAVGIAVCGSGVGAFVFAPFMAGLMEVFDWKDTMLILAGLMLNCAVFGALYRPLRPPPLPADLCSAADADSLASSGHLASLRRRVGSGTSEVSEADIVRYVRDLEGAGERARTHSECRPGLNVPATALIHSTPNLGAKKAAVVAVAMPRAARPEEYAKPMNRKDIFYTGSVFNMSRLGSAGELAHRSGTIAQSNQLIGSWILSMTRLPAPDDEPGGRRACWQRVPRSLRDVFAQMTDFSLLSRPPYLFTWIGNILFMIGYYVPFFLMVDFAAIHHGVPESKASLLLSVIGITNTIGRVFFGWLVGLPCVSALLVNNLTILLSGVITLFVPFCSVYPLMMTYAVFYGLLVAPVISLTSEILCNMFGIDKLTNAFGLLTLARGLSASAGPPFAGFLYDATHRFDIPYFASGGVIIGSALFFFLLHLPRFQRQMLTNMREMEGQQLAMIAASSQALNQEEAHTGV